MAKKPAITDDMTLYRALRHVTERYPERPALTFNDQTLTYRQLLARVDALARGLRGLGVSAGDKVGILMANSLEFVIAFFAPAALGAAFVPINPVYRQREMQHILADSEASVVIADPKAMGNDVEGILRAIRPSLPCLQHVILRGGAVDGYPDLASLLADQTGATSDVTTADRVPSDALCALIYTSGTTGVPKAVMQSHRSMISAVFQSQGTFDRSLVQRLWQAAKLTRRHGTRFLRYGLGQITLLSPAPLHALLGYSSLIYGLLYGMHVVIADRFHPAHVLELIEREHVVAMILAPTMLNALLASPDFTRRDHTSVCHIIVSSAPCPPELARRGRQAFGCPVYIAFGATEVGGATLVTNGFDPDSLQTETVGRAVLGTEARIVDDARRPLPPGQIGELALRLKSAMLGYYKASELTAQALDREGWYYTGDLATMDARGYVRIVGRKKDMIIRGGQNVFPAEIENHLLSKPGILQVAVVGVPDALAGERVWAYVVPQPATSLAASDVWDYCRKELAAFKVPDQVRIVDSLPLTSTGKPQKFALREMALAELHAAADHSASAGRAAPGGAA